jgi:SAM-dependent methyltransferase
VLVVEGNDELVVRARRQHGLHATRGSVDRLPLRDGSAGVVCLLDVIEHLADPVAALQEAGRVLDANGRLVINVPAHGWLWSAADDFLGHVRRYTRSALRNDLAAGGFEPILMTHVFSWLVLPVWVKRRSTRGDRAELGLDQTAPLVGFLAMVLTRLERSVVGRASLPLGTSVLCVAHKVADN